MRNRTLSGDKCEAEACEVEAKRDLESERGGTTRERSEASKESGERSDP